MRASNLIVFKLVETPKDCNQNLHFEEKKIKEIYHLKSYMHGTVFYRWTENTGITNQIHGFLIEHSRVSTNEKCVCPMDKSC